MKYFVEILLILIISCINFAQKDTSSIKLEEVSVGADSLQRKNYNNIIYKEFDQKDIQNSHHTDAASLINSISSITLKDYGGVGGLKTISVRGFSAEHNGVLIHSIPMQNSQTGSINLGGLRTENIHKMSFAIGSINDPFYPTKANTFVSILDIIPRELMTGYQKLNSVISMPVASFTTFEPFFSINGKVGNGSFLGANFRYLYSKGNYPYKMDINGTEVKGDRENSLVRNLQGNIGGIHKLKKGDLRYRLSYETSNKELPGAIILFDSSRLNQSLIMDDFNTQLNYSYKHQKWTAFVFGQYSYNHTNYRDPDFLNSTGGLNDNYWMNIYSGGITFSLSPIAKMSILLGADNTFSTVVSNKSSIRNTYRNDLKSMIGWNYSFWRMKIKANTVLTYIFDENNDERTFEAIKMNPYVSVGLYPFKKLLFHVRLFYKNSLRSPTMNELYYNQVIKNVEPETAHQFNVGLSYRKTDWSFLKSFQVGMDFYKNWVRNKIVLIPTQNLFIWSVTNVGETDITGLDFVLNFRTGGLKGIEFFFDLKYSLLLALDVTDPDSKTFKNQLPYIPQDNFTATFGLEFSGFGFSWSMIYGGERYALAENIESNKLEDYFINDCSLFYRYRFKDQKNSLRIQVSVLNALNEQYVMVRSFPMPGINYNVKLLYEFNH